MLLSAACRNHATAPDEGEVLTASGFLGISLLLSYERKKLRRKKAKTRKRERDKSRIMAYPCCVCVCLLLLCFFFLPLFCFWLTGPLPGHKQNGTLLVQYSHATLTVSPFFTVRVCKLLLLQPVERVGM